MTRLKQISLRIPEQAYFRLKAIALVRQMSMSNLMAEMIETYRWGNAPGDNDEHVLMVLKNLWHRDEEHEDTGTKGKKRKKELIAQITDLRNQGAKFQDIADYLNSKGIETISGRGTWKASTIHNLLTGS